MKYDQYDILAYGTNAILVRWEAAPSRELWQHLIEIKLHLEQCFKKEIILTYQELLIKNIEPSTSRMEEVAVRLRKKNEDAPPLYSPRLIRVPVCYEAEMGEDIEFLAEAKNLSISQLISLHTAPEYLVYFMGFLPGFPYLLGLNPQLHTSRKEVPSRKLIAGCVAIGGEQTGIYPQDSPGGWHVIGHCPIALFDATLSESTLFLSGDRVKFEPISKQEHLELSRMSLEEFKKSSYLSHG